MDLTHSPLHVLSKHIKNRKLSASELTRSIIERIDKVDEQIGAYITVATESALRKAQNIDDTITRDGASSPLTGIPVAIKDNICTKELLTTCGSKMLQNFIPPYDATVVERLMEGHTIPIGKTNMDEFGMGSSTEKSYYKVTSNPWDRSRVAGGSSGGSAAAVASGQAVFALGSDTGGSIRQPASYCGIVGLKPTYGLISRFGLVAYASSLDQIGTFTKDVQDCALVLRIIAGHDPKDSTSCRITVPDYERALTGDIRGLSIALPREYFKEGLNPEVREHVQNAARKMESLGAIVEEVSLPLTEYATPAYYIIACAEASSNLSRFDGVRYGYRSEEGETLNEMYLRTRSEGFGPEVKRRILLGTFVLSSGYYDAYYKKAQQVRTLIRKGYSDILSKYDVILCPVTPDTAFGLGEKSKDPLEMYLEDIYTVSLNIAGLPGISVPCGFDRKGLPIGMQIIGKAFDESTILKIAHAFEQHTDFKNKRPLL